MNHRRELLKKTTAIAVAGSMPVWQKPLVNAIVLPAHAQTSTVTVSCSMVLATGGSPTLPEMGSTNENVIITFQTFPPQYDAPITWRGLCDDVLDFPPQNAQTFGESDLVPGGFEIVAITSALCSGGPPAPGQVITHSFTFDANGATTECSYIYQP